MKNILLSAALIFNISIFAQAPIIQWQKCFGGTNTDSAHSILQTADGGYIAMGKSRSTDIDAIGNHGQDDLLIIKMDYLGTILWKKIYGGSGPEMAGKIQQTSDGGYIIIGSTWSNDNDVSGNHGNLDVWVIKLDTSGNLTWQKCFGGNNQDTGNSVVQTSDGGYILSCNTFSNNGQVSGNHGTTDAWIVKLTTSGEIVWQKCFGGSNFDSAVSIQNTTDGGYVFIGNSSSNNGDVSGTHSTTTTDYWVAKISAIGVLQWQKALGGTSDEVATCIRQTSDGGYIISGRTASTNGDVTGFHGWNDYWIVKINSTGTLVWQKTFGGTQEEVAWDVIQTADGGYIVTGYAGSPSGDGDVLFNHSTSIPTLDIWILRLDATGTILWQKSLGSTGYQESFAIQQTADSGFVVAGGTGGSSNGDVTGFLGGNLDFWIVKLGDSALSNNEFDMQKVTIYPNPVSSTLSISGNIDLQNVNIFDLQGRLVKSIAHDFNQIDVADLQNGSYILQYVTASQTNTIKFIKI